MHPMIVPRVGILGGPGACVLADVCSCLTHCTQMGFQICVFQTQLGFEQTLLSFPSSSPAAATRPSPSLLPQFGTPRGIRPELEDGPLAISYAMREFVGPQLAHGS